MRRDLVVLVVLPLLLGANGDGGGCFGGDASEYGGFVRDAGDRQAQTLFPAYAYYHNMYQYQSVDNFAAFSLDVAACLGALPAGTAPVVCEGFAVTAAGRAYFNQINSRDGRRFVADWIGCLVGHPRVRVAQFPTVDFTVAVAVATTEQADSVRLWNHERADVCETGVGASSACGCVARWTDVVCDTWDGECPPPGGYGARGWRSPWSSDAERGAIFDQLGPIR